MQNRAKVAKVLKRDCGNLKRNIAKFRFRCYDESVDNASENRRINT